jgi:hypothetical protein
MSNELNPYEQYNQMAPAEEETQHALAPSNEFTPSNDLAPAYEE